MEVGKLPYGNRQTSVKDQHGITWPMPHEPPYAEDSASTRMLASHTNVRWPS